MEQQQVDTESECEYLEKVEQQLKRRSALEDNVAARQALRMYVDCRRNESAVRDLRRAHQRALKKMNLRIQLLQHAIQKAEGKNDVCSDVTAALSHPQSHKDILYFIATLKAKQFSELRAMLEEAFHERDVETAHFERELLDVMSQSTAVSNRQRGIVRGFLVHKPNGKASRRLQDAAVGGLRGDAMGQQKRAENSLFVAFFDEHATFAGLKHSELVELTGMFNQADANNSGYVEEDDFAKLVRRLLCDYGVSHQEVERIAFLCHLSVGDGFALSVEPFFDTCKKLIPLIEQKAAEIFEVEEETAEELRARSAQAADDAKELFHIELTSSKKMAQIRQDTSLTQAQQEDQLVDEIMILEKAREEWAKRAVVLTVTELDRLRAHKMATRKKKYDEEDALLTSPAKGPRSLPTVAKPPTAAAAAAPPSTTTHRVGSARSQRGGSASSRGSSQSACAILETFKNSLRSALHRAPFVRIRTAADIPDERLQREFYQLFSILSKQEDFISADHIHFLLDIFTPCGADAEEATVFLTEECNGAETLIFDEFIKYGVNLKHRLLAHEAFAALPSDRERNEAIEQRVKAASEVRGSSVALRRYEKEFLRAQSAKQFVVEEHKRRTTPSQSPRPGSGGSTRQHHGTTPMLQIHEKGPTGSAHASEALEWAAPPQVANHEERRESPQRAQPSRRKAHSARKDRSGGVEAEASEPAASAASRGLRRETQAPLPKFVEHAPRPVTVRDYRVRQDDTLIHTLRTSLMQS